MTISPGNPTSASVKKQTILIVDDHPIVRRGLSQLIDHEPDIQVCGEAESVDEAFELVRTLRPDLAVVDISLKNSHGIELIAQIKTSHPEVKVLVWSMYDEKLFAERVVRAGAMGYIDKQQSIENVVDAIRQVLTGEMYLSSQMTRRILQRVGGQRPLEDDPVGSLSNRELEVFEMIGRGMATREIARKLDLSPKTIEAHREKIKTKLNLKNAAALSQRAVQWVLENG